MFRIFARIAGISFCLLSYSHAISQLRVSPESSGAVLAQKLVGEGVSISNVVLTGSPLSTGVFKNISGTQIGLDSGIVLTNGRAKTTGSTTGQIGLEGNGINNAQSALASLANFPISTFSGDADLATLIGVSPNQTHDATILEFDFVPLGDSIKFRYVFSSEEYPEYACPGPGSNYNDAFAFFIEGPGFAGKTNIALIPGTNQPVTINNINGEWCSPFPQYYINNESNTQFTHNGHTIIMTAVAKVQPCETYHLKLVIADVIDGLYDSGVFLESKSLSSNIFQLTNLTQTDPDGNSYLVEGCATGALKIQRPNGSQAQVLRLAYGGSAINGIDVQALPTSVLFPANETEVVLNIVPVVDNIAEGIENLVIYILAACGTPTPTDSATIQIRDYDILSLSPGMHPDTAYLCRNGSQVLTASTGYSQYAWDANATLSNVNSRTPVATPVNAYTKYYCTATEGSCHARDSLNLQWKTLNLQAKTDIICANANTGSITIAAGRGWDMPYEFSINNQPWQAGATFYNLPRGNYTIRIKDGTGCTDSIVTSLADLYAPITMVADVQQPSCLSGIDGRIRIQPAGGNPPYRYSLGGVNFQDSNLFIAGSGTYVYYVKDASGCTVSASVQLTFSNTIQTNIQTGPAICEGLSQQLQLSSNAAGFTWTPASTLNNATVMSPVASPSRTTTYYVSATLGICEKKDSVTVVVMPAPVANAGADLSICFGANAQLNGSGGTSYAWTPNTYMDNPALASPLITRPLKDMIYYLQVTDANGCKSLRKDTVNVKLTPAVKIFAGRDTMVAINQPIQLAAKELSNSGVVSWSWSPTFALNSSQVINPVVTSDRNMTYYVTGKTILGCEGSDTLNLKVYKGPEIYVPSAFTPNRDGLNDILKPVAIGMRQFNYFRIYNRWGQLIFESRDFNKGWNGMLNGKTQDPGSYVWIAEAVDYRGNLVQRKGLFSLLR